MEKLLHYVWMHKLLPSSTLKTTDGTEVEVMDPGQHNGNQGPDFLNARIKADGIVWAGNVEIHTCSSDWKPTPGIPSWPRKKGPISRPATI